MLEYRQDNVFFPSVSLKGQTETALLSFLKAEVWSGNFRQLQLKIPETHDCGVD